MAMHRTDRRYVYLVSDTASAKKRRKYTGAVIVGADWYIRGYMVRRLFATSYPSTYEAWPHYGRHDANFHSWQDATQDYSKGVLSSMIRELGTLTTLERVQAMGYVLRDINE